MFKQGQTVVANKQHYSSFMTPGKEYKVNRVDNDLVYVTDDLGCEEGFFSFRFDALTTPTPISLLSPQCQTVLNHLMDAGSITQREAIMDHSVQSLTKRIADLRAANYKIDGQPKTHPVTGQRYMRYVLAA